MDISRPLPFSAGALLGAGLFGAASALATPDVPDADPSSGVENAQKLFAGLQSQQTADYLSLVLGVVGAGLLLVGLPALLVFASRRGRRSALAAVAAVVVTLGALGNVGLNGAGAGSIHTLSNGAVDPATAAAIWAQNEGLGLGIFAIAYFLLLPLGSLLVAIAQFRARLVPVRVPVLLAVGGLLLLSPSDGVASKLLPLPFWAAVAVLGVLALRRGEEVELNPQPLPPSPQARTVDVG